MRTSSRFAQTDSVLYKGRNFELKDTKFKPKNIDFSGTQLSNYHAVNKFAINNIYVNPNVTREGQQELSDKLHHEISAEDELTESFLNREKPTKNKEQDNAKIFNDFCVQFIESSTGTKEGVSNTLNDVHSRLEELESLRSHLEEVERESYRFEMHLPDKPLSIKEQQETEDLFDF